MKKELIVPANHRGGAWGTATQAVRAGNLIFVGGQMSLDEEGRVVGSDITAQARNVFEALKRVLAMAGAGLGDVVKHNVYFNCDGDPLTVARFIAELDLVRLAYFSTPGPTTTETRCGLDREGALILVDAWAVVGGERERLSPAGHWSWDRKLPFSQGWRVDDMIFIGGQRSLDRQGRPLGVGDVETQTENAFRFLDAMLQAAGAGRSNLMRQNTYYRVFGEGREATAYWEKMTKVRLRYMSAPSAAGIGLGVPGFADADELIQVEGIAVLGKDKQRLQPANHWDVPAFPNAQFSQGWRIGPLAFVGGQVSADRNAMAVGADLETQTRNVFTFVRNVLAEGGLDETDVVRLCIYYLDDGNRDRVTETKAVIARIQREFYPEPGPCVTAYGVTGYSFADLFVEMEAIAVTRD